MALPRICVVVLLAVAAVAAVTGQLQPPLVNSVPPEMVAADVLTSLYLRLETALWMVIRSNAYPLEEKLKRIHETHLTLLETGFGEHHVQLNRLDPDEKHMSDAIKYIDQMVTAAQNLYLHDDASRRRREDAVSYAQYGVNMSAQMNVLFNVTESTGFYQQVARVSEQRESNVMIFV